MSTNLEHDGLEQLHIVLHCIHAFRKHSESFKQKLMHACLRKDEDKAILLRGVGQQEMEDLQQDHCWQVPCCYSKQFLHDGMFAQSTS